MKVILASQNQHKLVELSAILSQLGFEIALESEYGLHVDVDETGTTFEENSLLKAEAVMKASGMPVLAAAGHSVGGLYRAADSPAVASAHAYRILQIYFPFFQLNRERQTTEWQNRFLKCPPAYLWRWSAAPMSASPA